MRTAYFLRLNFYTKAHTIFRKTHAHICILTSETENMTAISEPRTGFDLEIRFVCAEIRFTRERESKIQIEALLCVCVCIYFHQIRMQATDSLLAGKQEKWASVFLRVPFPSNTYLGKVEKATFNSNQSVDSTKKYYHFQINVTRSQSIFLPILTSYQLH